MASVYRFYSCPSTVVINTKMSIWIAPFFPLKLLYFIFPSPPYVYPQYIRCGSSVIVRHSSSTPLFLPPLPSLALLFYPPPPPSPPLLLVLLHWDSDGQSVTMLLMRFGLRHSVTLWWTGPGPRSRWKQTPMPLSGR